MPRSRIVILLICLVWGVSLSQAQSQACRALGDTIHLELTPEYPAYADPPSAETLVSRGSVQRLYWDEADCILVQTSLGLWRYPNSLLDAPPTRIKAPADRPDIYLFTRMTPEGDLGASVRPFAYSLDGRLLARLGQPDRPYEKVMELVDRETGRVLGTASDIPPYITQLEFNIDQTLILGATNHGRVVGWSTEDLGEEPFILGEPISYYRNESAIVPRYTSHPMAVYGNTLVIGHGDGTIQIWDLATRSLLHTLSDHVGSITELAFDGKGRVLSASLDGDIRLWDLTSGQSLGRLPPLDGHAAPILDFVLNARGTQILSADSLGVLRIRDVAFTPSNVLTTVPTPLLDVAVNEDATVIATAGEDGTVRLYSSTGSLIQDLGSHDGMANAVAISPDGQTVISGGSDATTRRWDLSDDTSDQVLDTPLWPVRDVAFMPNNEEWMSVGWDKIPRSHRPDSIYGMSWVSDDEYIESIAVSPNFSLFATGNWRGEIHVWPFGPSSSYRQPIRLMSNPNAPSRINALVFHPNRPLLAAASQDGSISIWDVSTPSIVLVGTMMGDLGGINDLAFTPDAQSLIGVSHDIFIWDTTTWFETGFRRGGGSPIMGLALSSDGEQMVTVDLAGVVRMQRIHPSPFGQERVASHFGPPIDATAFDDSRTRVALSRTEIGIWIWTPNGEREGILRRGTTDPYTPLSFSSNADILDYVNGTKTGLTVPSWGDAQ